MFDLGWQELFIIATLVIIVIGPKDMPRTLRAVSGWIRKGRELAREFQGGVNDMVRQADLDDIKHQIDAERLTRDIENRIDPDGAISREVRNIQTGAIEAGLDPDQVKAAVSDEALSSAPEPSAEPESAPVSADAKKPKAAPPKRKGRAAGKVVVAAKAKGPEMASPAKPPRTPRTPRVSRSPAAKRRRSSADER
jgi:sec-independent protein translocase protein TatB